MRDTSPPREDVEEREQRSVQSIEVGGRLLLALAANSKPMTLKDLSAAAGLTPSRAHPYLVSFGRLRLIEQEPDSGRYALGPAALQLGLTCLHQLDPVRAALPIAESLASSTGHAVALAIWGNFGPTVIRMIDARRPLHVTMRAGTVMSLLGTSTGRAFAAVMRPDCLDTATGSALGDPHGRELALVGDDAEVLRDIVAEFREHGLTRAVGRPIPSVNAFSGVAFDHEGEPAIVITALGHEDSFPSDWNAEVADAVRAAAAEISHRLGWRGRPRLPDAAGEPDPAEGKGTEAKGADAGATRRRRDRLVPA